MDTNYPKTISNLAVTIFNQQRYHYCWCKTWNMDYNKALFMCYSITVVMVNKNKFTNYFTRKWLTNNLTFWWWMVNNNLTLMMVTKWSTTAVQRQRITTNTSTHLGGTLWKTWYNGLQCVTNFSDITFTLLTLNLMMADQSEQWVHVKHGDD